MAIPKQTTRFDDRRNTSRVFAPAPDALPNATRALERWRRENAEHARWIEDGAPTLSDAEHAARFGEPYVMHRSARTATSGRR